MGYWCAAADVRYRVPQATAGKWSDEKVEARIDRAEEHLRPIFTPMYGSTEVTSWATTAPDLVKNICADVAAAFLFTDWYGEAQMKDGKPGEVLMKRATDEIDRLRKRETYLIDASGEMIDQVDTGKTMLESTTRETEPTFTLGKRALDESRPGSLDWG